MPATTRRIVDCAKLMLGFLPFWASMGVAQDEPTLKIGLDVRIDTEVTKTKWDKNTNGEVDSLTERFVLTSGRFNIWGKIDNATTYRIRYEMKGNHTEAGADGITSAINYFYIDHAFGEHLYLRLGKQFIVTSSWEFHNNRSQAYHYSETFLKVPTTSETGAQMGVKVAGQTFAAQITNSVPENVHKNRRDFTKGIFWYGEIGDKLLQPIISYALFPRAPSEVAGEMDERVSTSVLSVGTKINLKPFDFDLYGGRVSTPKYRAYELDASGSAIESSYMAEEWTTIIAYARYKIAQPKLHPFVKLSHDIGKIAGKNYFQFTRYSFGAEWFPTSEHFWLHAVYVGQHDKFLKVEESSVEKQGANTRKIAKYLVGVGSAF